MGVNRTLRADFNAYRDKYGLVQPKPDSPGRGGLLYSSLYYALLVREGLAKPLDLDEHRRLVGDSEIVSGLLSCDPVATHQQTVDAYIGVTAASALIDPHRVIAKEVFDFGLTTGFLYNNVRPNMYAIYADHGSHVGFIAHLQFARGAVPDFLERAEWVAAIILSCLKSKQQLHARISAYLMLQTAGEMHLCSRFAGAIFKWKLKIDFPEGGMGEVFQDLFRDNLHPLSLHYWGIYR